MYLNTLGIILNQINFRGSDSFFSIYTLESGKIRALCRSARNSKSKMGGHLDYFSIIDLMIARGKKFNHIGGAIREKNFLNLKKNFEKINLGFYGLEVTDYFIKENKPDPKIFYILKEWLEILNKNFNYQKSLFFTYEYILKLLSLLGYNPELSFCLKCRKKIGKDIYFSPAEGGVICGQCRFRDNYNLSSGDLLFLKAMSFGDFGNFQTDRKMPFSQFKKIIKIIDEFLLYRLDKEIKSRSFVFR